ncbi:hypothetical protein A3B18_04010 [Candidatus Giovannonibacteria bacterium RIFCSPLOWO2_01_FULL_46_13]|uniref:CDP-diacylglycerol--glycerol-3-phosphate 3-phosphatidyltransferase n=1 Tax=Candidatus Giovannonibacteria bacterium RIFCSPLOWO2_01_FULL_46_13 TaxID=1798352 RepID=A0A1F5X4Y7_9BACT|nr:MAG: hypothetical protein A3E35_00925 [Candidatus Giovannonibacteria bacterium RIFCSPHIGHO2_12_FULL_44_22]OGF82937.1 MAG: hypothetical protein A3B18_04010 [Candidatus Giovannonibacteria bacterium RIFCSPLOWO2_01_FULL_46_13]
MEALFNYGWALKESYLRELVRFLPSWVTANHITYLRILVASCVWYLYVTGLAPRLIPLLVCFAVMSDLFDGPLARERKQESACGANIDPIADKLIILTVFGFELYAQLPLLVGAILGGELLSVVMRFAGFALKYDARANLYGKIKMVVQSMALIPIFGGWHLISEIVLIAALFLGALSIHGQINGFLDSRRN